MDGHPPNAKKPPTGIEGFVRMTTPPSRILPRRPFSRTCPSAAPGTWESDAEGGRSDGHPPSSTTQQHSKRLLREKPGIGEGVMIPPDTGSLRAGLEPHRIPVSRPPLRLSGVSGRWYHGVYPAASSPPPSLSSESAGACTASATQFPEIRLSRLWFLNWSGWEQKGSRANLAHRVSFSVWGVECGVVGCGQCTKCALRQGG